MAKRRTAKQKAATRKLVALNKRRRASKPKKSSSRKRTVKRVIRSIKPRVRMARRRTMRRSAPRRKSGGFLKGLPLIGNSTFKKAAAGIGTATLGVAALSLVAPGIASSPLVKPVLALAGGDFIGLGAQLFTGGGLNGILGGGGSSGNMEGLA